jgi:Co/Zn/Cd efflux system component
MVSNNDDTTNNIKNEGDPPSSTKIPPDRRSNLADTDRIKTNVDKEMEEKHFNNVKVLTIMAVLFTLFVIAQILSAIASHSISLLGDASAMGVDVFTVSYNLKIYCMFQMLNRKS